MSTVRAISNGLVVFLLTLFSNTLSAQESATRVASGDSTTTQRGALKIRVRIIDNPADSSLSNPQAGTTKVRFEDYVSSPPPGHRDAVQGWVGQFSVPFTGLVTPLVANTIVSQLPVPVGLLMESPADTLGCYDPSSQVDCADARADRLVFRFVDPANTRRAATVSRIAFRVTGNSADASWRQLLQPLVSEHRILINA